MGPSYPAPAVQRPAGEQLPFLPEVTSKKFCVFCQMYDGLVETPRIVKDAATMGDDALVPPTTCQLPLPLESLQ